MNGIKNRVVTDENIQMTFCANCKNCPAVDMTLESDEVVVGGEEEGFTLFTKAQFKLFIEEAKAGTFDEMLKDVDVNCETNGGI